MSEGKTQFDFNGQTVIVTGAARGIGLSVCERFIAAGASVWMVDLDEDLVQAQARNLGGIAAPADVTDSQEVDRVVSEAAEGSGRIDVLFNNAGLLLDRVLWKIDDDSWQRVIDVSLGGTFRFTKACVPHFRRQEYGRIINVTSYTALHGNIGQASYAAAKAGVVGFTRTAAKELARFGVTVNAISPNAKTRMIDSIPGDQREKLEALIPLGRFADPMEISAAVLFLGSPDAGYITGVVLPVDGGISI